jgi:S1-C subfamily serine protease
MAEAPPPPGTGTPAPSRRIGARAAGAMRAGGGFLPFVAGMAVVLAVVGLYAALTPSTPPVTQQNVTDAIASALASQTPPPAFSEQLYPSVQPSLVLIESTFKLKKGQTEPDGGLGSGVVVNLDGDILTALHVVDGATAIELTFADGAKSPAEIVTTQPDHDIAVIHATEPPTNLVPATLGDPRSVQPGMEVYAMGSPFGLYGSVSAGIVSGLGRSFTMPKTGQTLTGLFQIDAAVNPGNSGGALVDRDGHVVGIVTALINPTKEDVFIGIGLAVPIDVAGGAAGLPPY